MANSSNILFVLVFILIHKTYQELFLGYWIIESGSEFLYEYNSVAYTSMEEMAKDIISDIKNVPLKEVYLYSYGYKKEKIYFKNIKNNCQCILNLFRNHLTEKGNEVCSYIRNGLIQFKSCGKIFKSFEDASKYSLKKQCNSKVNENIIEVSGKSDGSNKIKNNIRSSPTNKPIVTTKKFCVKNMYTIKCLKKNAISYKVWEAIWGDYGLVYYNDKYSVMIKARFLKEINFYRRIHSTPPLSDKNQMLLSLAQKHASLMAKQKRLFNYGDQKIGTIMGVVKCRYISFLIRMWYDEITYYKSDNNFMDLRTEELTAMLWKSTQNIGIGMASNDNKVYVVMKLYPKGNNFFQFKENVKGLMSV